MECPTYEEQFSRAVRHGKRAARWLRWHAKTFVGVRGHILVELRWRLGDEVMALPIYEALHNRYPNGHIALLCNYPDLVEDNPFVDAVNEVPLEPDQYLLLRTGPRDIHRIEHYARCAGVPVPAARPRLYYRDWSTRLLAGIAPPIIAVAAGASWPTKRWPMDRWRALCGALEGLGCSVVELGQGDERIGVGTCLLDKTTVREAACVLHAAKLLICCDSGLMHLALAAGTRALALFGPTEPTILVRNEPRLTALKSKEPCQGCWNRPQDMVDPGVCPLGRPACLDSITLEAVLAEARQLLDAGE